MQDDGKLAGNCHRCLLRSDAFAKGLAQVFSALGRADRLSNTLAASNRRPRTMPSPHLEIRPARSTSPD